MSSTMRKPRLNEKETCTRLLYISGPDLYTYVFIQPAPQIYPLLELLFTIPNSIYSKDLMTVEEKDGTIRGLLLTFPAREIRMLGRNVLRNLFRILRVTGLNNFIKMLFHMKLNRYFPPIQDDELFISNIAVFEQYRGQGIGLNLLKHAENMAREMGLGKLCLYVESDNGNAIRIYKKFGFIQESIKNLPKHYHKHQLFGFIKMVKELK